MALFPLPGAPVTTKSGGDVGTMGRKGKTLGGSADKNVVDSQVIGSDLPCRDDSCDSRSGRSSGGLRMPDEIEAVLSDGTHLKAEFQLEGKRLGIRPPAARRNTQSC